jgi:hypothetical protein
MITLFALNANAADYPPASTDCQKYKNSYYKPTFCETDTPKLKRRGAPRRIERLPPQPEHPLDIIPNFLGRLIGEVSDGLETTVNSVSKLNPMEDD